MNANNKNQMELSQEESQQLILGYCDVLELGVKDRWKLFNVDLMRSNFFEVLGGLLSRQANLAISFAKNPGIWNPHISPLVYRAHVDAYITLAWILEGDGCDDRAEQYIHYGLGQEKLQIEHLKNSVTSSDSEDDIMSSFISSREAWLNNQLFDFLTDVNLGSWSGLSTREMAIKANCLDLYNFAYAPFSAGAHSTWAHVARHDLKICNSPLHKEHRIPFIENGETMDLDIHELTISAKYAQKTFNLVDEKLNLTCETILPRDYLVSKLSAK